MATLDGWAERVRSETERHLYRYRANPREFESSEGYFRMLMMAVVVYEDFSVRYNPERITTPGALDPNDHFFADSRDLFLHGLLGSSPSQLSTPRPLGPLNPQPSTLNRSSRDVQFHAGALRRHWPAAGLSAQAGHHEVALVHPVGRRGGAVRPGGHRQRA